ncbi:MAG TPA: alpha/beta hydrolase [Candidatus Nitrosocosmicus sp.]|nr:alpha/beta hydrolase [Candidatus Nitrosocosmicus sp.]
MVNGFTNIVNGQTNVTQANSTNATTNLVNTQDIPLQKVLVGDIEMAYKIFGKGDPIILHNGASDNMDAWDPAFLTRLASNHMVIIFDSRGIGNTTIGTEPYTYPQLANDTAGLLDALKISKADVMGYSLGGHIAQAFTISHPEKVDSLILVASSCGGKDGIPKPAEFLKLQADVVNKSLHNIPITQELKALNVASLGSGWIKLHPDSVDIPANTTSLQQLKPGLSPEMANNQNSLGIWEDTNWSGVCDAEAKLAKPTLAITGTDDNDYMPHENALIIASKVPGAWLVQIKDAGHAIMNQYPDKVGNIINTFLSTVK